MGLMYYRVASDALVRMRPLINAHENEMVGPRARGYWFDRPDDYDYAGVQSVARELDEAGHAAALEQLELSEVEAHSLALLDITLPSDGLEYPPPLLLHSSTSAGVRQQVRILRKRLGATPDAAQSRFVLNERDPRFAEYLGKQLRHLRETLPRLWHFYERTADTGDAILVVDLRARDLDIPEEIELSAAN